MIVDVHRKDHATARHEDVVLVAVVRRKGLAGMHCRFDVDADSTETCARTLAAIKRNVEELEATIPDRMRKAYEAALKRYDKVERTQVIDWL